MSLKVPLHFLCCLLLVQIVDVNGDARRKSCGAELHKRISLVCDALGGFNTYYAGVSHHRVKRRIVDECCRKPCSFYTIAKYCNYDADEIYRKSAEMDTKDALENLGYHKMIRREAVYFPFKNLM